MYLPLTLFSTVVIWLFFTLILFSNTRHPLNRLCFISGMLFSLGTFKEYFYYDLAPVLLASGYLSSQTAQNLYAIMTSILYLSAMPTAFLFALHFYRSEGFHFLKKWGWVLLLPAALLAILFPPVQTYKLQRSSLSFWICFCCYNMIYGILFTFLMIKAIIGESSSTMRRQKRCIALLLLPPLWYWLITIFLFHTLQLNQLLQWWKGNLFFIVFAIGVYLYLAFHDGIMGLRLNTEHYQWELESQAAFRGAQFLSHTLKRDLVKLSWCSYNLKEKIDPNLEEAQILANTVEHLQGLSDRILLYSGEIVIHPQHHSVQTLLKQPVEEFRGKNLEIHCRITPHAQLYCDLYHIQEVLRNLLENALEAEENTSDNSPKGVVEIAFFSGIRRAGHRGHFDLLMVWDNGPGIDTQQKNSIFFPYHTQKAQTGHLGLGLYYCRQVMLAHGGWIQPENTSPRGFRQLLWFPQRR